MFLSFFSPIHSMSVKLHNQSLVSTRSSNLWLSRKSTRTHFSNKKIISLDHVFFNWGYSRKRCRIRFFLLNDGNLSRNCRLVDFRGHCLTFRKSNRMRYLLPFASADDGVTINGTPQANTSSDVEEMRVKLDQSLQGEDYSTRLVQSLHDAARIFELAIKEQGRMSKISWFSTAWLGGDKNAWVKALSYQASVYALLQAASEISSRGDGRDRDINVFVQRRELFDVKWEKEKRSQHLVILEFNEPQPHEFISDWPCCKLGIVSFTAGYPTHIPFRYTQTRKVLTIEECSSAIWSICCPLSLSLSAGPPPFPPFDVKCA